MRQPGEKKPIMVQAADLLARQEHSSAKLREKLRRRGYAEEEIAVAIEKLTAAHYLNDEDACQRAFDYFYQEKRLSVRKIMQKLMQRGFERDMIKSCIPDDISLRELEAALYGLRHKFSQQTPREKMQQYLYLHGFDGSICRSAIENYTEEMKDKWERENDSEE